MSTIINNPSNQESSGLGIGLFLGIVIVGLALLLFYFYGIPGLGTQEPAPAVPENTADIDISIPAVGNEPAGGGANSPD